MKEGEIEGMFVAAVRRALLVPGGDREMEIERTINDIRLAAVQCAEELVAVWKRILDGNPHEWARLLLRWGEDNSNIHVAEKIMPKEITSVEAFLQIVAVSPFAPPLDCVVIAPKYRAAMDPLDQNWYFCEIIKSRCDKYDCQNGYVLTAKNHQWDKASVWAVPQKKLALLPTA
ncbi:MAG: hypothetical protein ACYC8S_00480 [Minisyncoccota bacterium]